MLQQTPSSTTEKSYLTTFGSTSVVALKIYGYLKPVVQIMIEKCPSHSKTQTLEKLLVQTDEYIDLLKSFHTSKSAGSQKGNSKKNKKAESTNNPDKSKKSNEGIHGVKKPTSLVTNSFAFDSVVPLFVPLSSNLTEEQMLQCVGCYFLSYHSIYPMLDPAFWYRRAKKTWRNMEFGIPQPAPNATAEEKAEIAVIYVLIALGAQECSRQAVFSGISPHDWSKCYFSRAIDLLAKDNKLKKTDISAVFDQAPSVTLAKFGYLASLYEATQLHDAQSISFATFSIEMCNRCNLRKLGEVLQEIERKGGRGVDHKPPSTVGAKAISEIEALRSQYPPEMDLNDACRTYVICLLWTRMLYSHRANIRLHHINKDLFNSVVVNYNAFESIGFHNVQQLEKRVLLHDVVKRVVEYATSTYIFQDPVSALKKIQSSIRELMGDPNGDAMDIDLESKDFSMHFNFVTGHDGLAPQNQQTTASLGKSNESLQERTKRTFRAHFVALFMFSQIFLYRPCPLASLILRGGGEGIKVDPTIRKFFDSFAAELFNITGDIYNEIIYPILHQKRLEPDYEETNVINGTDGHVITAETLQKSVSKLPSQQPDDSEDLVGAFSLLISGMGVELVFGPLLYFCVTGNGDLELDAAVKKSPKSNLLSAQQVAIERFAGCVEFVLSEQQDIDKHNMRSAMIAEAAVSESGASLGAIDLPSSYSVTGGFVVSKHGPSSGDDLVDSKVSASNFKLVPSPANELLRTIVQLLRDPSFLGPFAESLDYFDRLKVAKYLLSKQAPSPSMIPPLKEVDPKTPKLAEDMADTSPKSTPSFNTAQYGNISATSETTPTSQAIVHVDSSSSSATSSSNTNSGPSSRIPSTSPGTSPSLHASKQAATGGLSGSSGGSRSFSGIFSSLGSRMSRSSNSSAGTVASTDQNNNEGGEVSQSLRSSISNLLSTKRSKGKKQKKKKEGQTESSQTNYTDLETPPAASSAPSIKPVVNTHVSSTQDKKLGRFDSGNGRSILNPFIEPESQTAVPLAGNKATTIEGVALASKRSTSSGNSLATHNTVTRYTSSSSSSSSHGPPAYYSNVEPYSVYSYDIIQKKWDESDDEEDGDSKSSGERKKLPAGLRESDDEESIAGDLDGPRGTVEDEDFKVLWEKVVKLFV